MKEIKHVVLPVDPNRKMEPLTLEALGERTVKVLSAEEVVFEPAKPEDKQKYIVMTVNKKNAPQDIFSQLPGGFDGYTDNTGSRQREMQEELLVSRTSMHDKFEDKPMELKLIKPMEERQTSDGRKIWAEVGSSQEQVDERGTIPKMPDNFVFPDIGITLPVEPKGVMDNILNARKDSEGSTKKLKNS